MASTPIVIAHRGASGYLPEHTLAAKVLAHAQGADYIEQDVVMTRDDQLVVLHDLYLDRVTDVAQQFPNRHRPDSHFYVVDFSLAELRRLNLTSPFILTPEGFEAEYPQRFPLGQSRFGIHTLTEEIELIQGLNQTTGREVGIYPEFKSPWFHRREGKDIAAAVLEVLERYGYDSREDCIYLQTFDFNELVRLREELLPRFGMDLKLVQLIADNSWLESYEQHDGGDWVACDYGWMHSEEGMQKLAHYAQAIGPHLNMIAAPSSNGNSYKVTGLVDHAQRAGLEVHAYTFRAEAELLPAYAQDFEQLLKIFVTEAGIDGLFTDFPDLTLSFVQDAG